MFCSPPSSTLFPYTTLFRSKGFFTALADAGYTGGMNIENEDQFYYPNYEGTDFTEAFKEGFRVAHAYVRQFVPSDRKSTRLNSSHLGIRYADFRLKQITYEG